MTLYKAIIEELNSSVQIAQLNSPRENLASGLVYEINNVAEIARTMVGIMELKLQNERSRKKVADELEKNGYDIAWLDEAIGLLDYYGVDRIA